MSVYKKILEVMKDVEYLQKDDKVQFEGRNGQKTSYKAISEEKVTQIVRDSLIKNGLVIIPVEQEHSKDGNLSTVNVKYKIVDTETGECEIAVSSGTGTDTQDKGVGKAMTYSYKYLLLRTFAIPTGEDPDKISSAELDEKFKKESQKAGNKKVDSKKATIQGKWQILYGSLDGFEDWYVKQSENFNDNQIDVYLTKKIKAKEDGTA